MKMEFLCIKCKKPQPRNEEKSTDKLNVYDYGQKCSCGGAFELFIDGEPVRGGE